MMTREEYDERKRLIDEQHRSTIELIEAGRQAQHRALDLIWLAGAEGGVTLASGSSPVLRLAAAPVVEEAPAPAAPAKRRGTYQLLGQIEAVLPSLPELFDYNDLSQALGISLDRGAVRRNLQLLVEEEILGLEPTESGRFRLRYSKLAAKAPEATD